MKIFVVEDDIYCYGNFLADFLKEAGHEVRITDEKGGTRPDWTVAELVSLIKSFEPDFVLIDHELKNGCFDKSFTGEDLAKALDFPPNRTIGISLGPQEYCQKYFLYKDNLKRAGNGLLELLHE